MSLTALGTSIREPLRSDLSDLLFGREAIKIRDQGAFTVGVSTPLYGREGAEGK
jgi:hypothetical protein